MKKTYQNRFEIQRRDLLKAIAKAGISTQLLKASSILAGVMVGRVAHAQGTPNKSCLVFSGGGCHPDKWFPVNGVLPAMTAPLQPYFSRMHMFKNAKVTGAGHGAMHSRFNNGNYGRSSFDGNMGETIGANYPVTYLNLGTTNERSASRIGSKGRPIITTPQLALQTLFGSSAQTPTNGTVSPRSAIVDLHFAAVNQIKSKLGQHEKLKIESHLDAIRGLETDLANATPAPGGDGGGGGACAQPNVPSGTLGFDALAKIQSEIVVLALDCNLTASVSMAFGTDHHNHVFDVFGRESHKSHHQRGSNNPEYIEDITYMQSLSANLLRLLDEKGLLDSTTYCQISDFGNADSHTNDNVPHFVAGAGITGGKVSDIAGKTQIDIFQSLGQLLGAHESPAGAAYRDWQVAGISGI